MLFCTYEVICVMALMSLSIELDIVLRLGLSLRQLWWAIRAKVSTFSGSGALYGSMVVAFWQIILDAYHVILSVASFITKVKAGVEYTTGNLCAMECKVVSEFLSTV